MSNLWKYQKYELLVGNIGFCNFFGSFFARLIKLNRKSKNVSNQIPNVYVKSGLRYDCNMLCCTKKKCSKTKKVTSLQKSITLRCSESRIHFR